MGESEKLTFPLSFFEGPSNVKFYKHGEEKIMSKVILPEKAILLTPRPTPPSSSPHIKPPSKALTAEAVAEATPTEEEREYDVVVRIPPKRRYSVKVKSVRTRKATPKPIPPGEFE